MQINGNSLSGVFVPQSYPFQGGARDPVIIDTELSFEVHDNNAPVFEVNGKQHQDIVINDQQQARFVRALSMASEALYVPNEQVILPKEIQHYVQISELELGQPQRIIDERV